MAGRAYITPVAWIQEEKDEEEQEEWSEARVDLSHHSSSNTAAPQVCGVGTAQDG